MAWTNHRGLSLTMPLKQVAMTCVDEVSETARVVAAVNTVIFEPGGERAVAARSPVAG